ncbi:hypothetical protein Tco_1249057 [Tanacetum coccineum]
MSKNEDKYHDTVLDLEAKVKKNKDTVLKIGNSLQGMFMLGEKPMSFYDSKLKHGLGYANPYTLKKAISHNLKLYNASCLDDSKIHMNVRDTEDILEDATKSQIKMKNKMKDPIAIQKKQNVCTNDYNKLNALYDDFVPQKELSDEQKYFPSSFISFEVHSNESSSYSSSETKPTKESMPSANPILVNLNQMENDFQKVLELLQKAFKQESIFYTSPEEIRFNEFYNNMKDEIEKVQRDSIEIQEGMRKCINILENDTSPNKQQAEGTNKNVFAPGMYKVGMSQVTNTNKAKSVLSFTRLSATSSVRRPSNKDSSFKNSVISNTKNSSKKVEVSDRINEKPDVASKNVRLDTTNDEIKNALKAKNVLWCFLCQRMCLPVMIISLAKYILKLQFKF